MIRMLPIVSAIWQRGKEVSHMAEANKRDQITQKRREFDAAVRTLGHHDPKTIKLAQELEDLQNTH